MRTIRNIVGLLFLGSLLVANGAGLKAEDSFDPYWSDPPSSQQNGAVCEYVSTCGFDGTPGTDYHAPGGWPWEDMVDYYFPLCGYDPYDVYSNYSNQEEEASAFCISFSNSGWGDPYGNINYSFSWSVSPYYTYVDEEFEGYCVDGTFTCSFQAEALCP